MSETSLGMSHESKTKFIKLNSDWNALNLNQRKNKEEFFNFMMNKFKEVIKKEMREKVKNGDN